MPSKQESSFDFSTLLVVGLFAVTFAAAIQNHGHWPPLFGATRATTKPYSDFAGFYPFYLGEHADFENRVLHVIGTSIVCLLFLRQLKLALAMAFALSVGYIACEMSFGMPQGFIEFGVMLGTYVLSSFLMTGSTGLHIPLVGYGFAWVGHFFFEGNRPATFIYPSYSLMGDYRMLFECLTGQTNFGK